jgi:hypothetical protein
MDQNTRVTLYANSKTGNIEVGSTFLHNTKISSSAYHENQAHKKQRDFKNPNGREVGLPEIIHKVSLLPEVHTNCSFVDISTKPFEERPETRYDAKQTSNQRRRNDNSSNSGGHNADGQDEEVPDRQDSSVPTQRLREQLPSEFHITDSQQLTYSEKKTRRFDMISLYGLREPRLLPVADNPEVYYRCFWIAKKSIKESSPKPNITSVEKLWTEDGEDDKRWFDCLKRWIRIKMSSIDFLEEYIKDNIDNVYSGDFTKVLMNEKVLQIIQLVKKDDQILSVDQLERKKKMMELYILDDSGCPPTIPVFSQITPNKADHFLIHLMLTLGRYETEKDILLKSSLRECFRSAGLIGDGNGEEDLRRDCGKILFRYIMEQLVFSPFTLSKAEYYILIGNQVILDAILLDGISMNEIPPVTMVDVIEKEEGEKAVLWTRMKKNQIDAILSQVNVDGAPSRDQLMNCTRQSPHIWDPVDVLVQSNEQSNESFAEQKEAVRQVVKEIKKYIDPHSLIQSTNPIIHGCPGSGKSFISLYNVLYCISQGLNICPTAVTGVNAARVGGLHWHPLLCIDPNQSHAPPQRQAELAILKLQRDPLKIYKLQTMHVLFIDKFYRFSSEQLSVTDIILRRVRNSSLPFGGVFIIANMGEFIIDISRCSFGLIYVI